MVNPEETAAVLEACRAAADEERTAARLIVVDGPDVGMSSIVDMDGTVLAGSLPGERRNDMVTDAITLMDREQSLTVTYGDVDVFIESLIPRPRLYVFGAVHIAQALTALSSLLGYAVVVSDSRPAFITPERFPEAVELLVGWPDEVSDRLVFDRRSFVVVLSHDARFEDPLWPLVMGTPVRYIGAMGSTRTAVSRRERLLAAGYDEGDVGRIHGPIGIDIGARTPGEVAVAILAEMTESRYRSNEELRLAGELTRVRR